MIKKQIILFFLLLGVNFSYAQVSGCTDGTLDDGTQIACNYDPAATVDDGSCEYPASGFDCDGSNYVCGDDFVGFNSPYESAEGHYYYISGTEYSWDVADQISQLYGFYLATFTSEDELEFVGNSIATGGVALGEFWIGLSQN